MKRMKNTRINKLMLTLRTVRKLRNLTQKELSTKLGYKTNIVTFWERGQHYPPLKAVFKMEEILNFKLKTTTYL